MAKLACAYWPNNLGYEIANFEPGMHESELLWLDSTRATKELDWNSRLSASEAIKWTLDWELESKKLEPLVVLDSQIDKFFQGDK